MKNRPNNEKLACLTLDLEQDYGRTDNYHCLPHLETLSNLLSEQEVKLTAFVVGKLLEEHPDQLKPLAAIGAEFGLHSYSHTISETPDTEYEIRRGKTAFEEFFGRSPKGYRSPQGRISETLFSTLQEEQFDYDSSVIPSWRPGVYSNMDGRTEPYMIGDVLEIPFSVIPKVRIPFIMSYLKLLGPGYDLLLKTFGMPDLLIFDFHMHDLFETSSIKQLPFSYRTIHSRNASKAVDIFTAFIASLKKNGYTFVTMDELAGRLNLPKSNRSK